MEIRPILCEMETHYESAAAQSPSDGTSKPTVKKQRKVFPLRCVIVTVLIAIVLNTAVTIAVMLIATNNSTSRPQVDVTDAYDVVIIGAGVTGLTNLYILSTASNVTQKTLLLERNNRVGGRCENL